MLAMLLFAVAVSVDGLAAGFAEGLRGIRVPLGSLVVMNVVSAVVVFLSIGSGRVMAGFFTPVTGRLIGGGLLIALGAWMLCRGQRSALPSEMAWHGNRVRRAGAACDGEARNGETEAAGSVRACAPGGAGARYPLRWPARFARSLAIVPGLLDEPARADLDSSGTLTPGEAFLLGLALAIDALAVGFGAGLAGLSATLTPLVASGVQTLFVGVGVRIGRRVKESVLAPGLEKAPGGILILLGLMRLK